jgi:hypothetical protein
VGPTQNQIKSNPILFLRPRAGDGAPLPVTSAPAPLSRRPRLRRTLATATAALRVRLYGPDDRAPPVDRRRMEFQPAWVRNPPTDSSASNLAYGTQPRQTSPRPPTRFLKPSSNPVVPSPLPASAGGLNAKETVGRKPPSQAQLFGAGSLSAWPRCRRPRT